MMEYRVRSKRSDDLMSRYRGAEVKPEMIQLLLMNKCRVFKPDGKLLCVYLPGVLKEQATEMWDDFSSIRLTTNNRGYAAGAGKRIVTEGKKRTSAPIITSSILGSIDMDRTGMREPVCRLTSFNAQQVDKWERLLPMFQEIGKHLEEQVPDRYANQVARANNTEEDWLIKGTPFTTITVNNTYPTGIHTDKGDLDEGFSTLACLRRGKFDGGWITFPQYGISADLQDGDLLLMDAHEWHGNTPLLCAACGESLRKFNHKCDEGLKDADLYGMDYVSPERVSIVSYYRTEVEKCGTAEEEAAKRAAVREEHNLKVVGLEYGEV